MVLIVRFDDFLCETMLRWLVFILKFYRLWKKYRYYPFALPCLVLLDIAFSLCYFENKSF